MVIILTYLFQKRKLLDRLPKVDGVSISTSDGLTYITGQHLFLS